MNCPGLRDYCQATEELARQDLPHCRRQAEWARITWTARNGMRYAIGTDNDAWGVVDDSKKHSGDECELARNRKPNSRRLPGFAHAVDPFVPALKHWIDR